MCTAVGISRRATIADLISLEKKLYFRFIKNEGCYNERFIKLFSESRMAQVHSIHNYFDVYLCWENTAEGSLFWYEKQIKLVIFLIKMNYKDKPMMLKYLENLCERNLCYSNKQWFKDAMEICRLK